MNGLDIKWLIIYNLDFNILGHVVNSHSIDVIRAVGNSDHYVNAA